MIKEQEIEYFRKFVINKYVDEVMANLSGEKRIEKSPFAQRPRRLTKSNRFKTCKKCGKLKRVTSFYKRTDTTDGLFSICKLCARRRGKELRREKKRQNANKAIAKLRKSA
jgi:hypothetical protein